MGQGDGGTTPCIAAPAQPQAAVSGEYAAHLEVLDHSCTITRDSGAREGKPAAVHRERMLTDTTTEVVQRVEQKLNKITRRR